ncbi:MAG: orotidine-5'-phosphate decarboxylase [Oligoflexia bacterium]|nr:orotidine-5'-phosphate decarboxylase [Oligoflexia bacterium]
MIKPDPSDKELSVNLTRNTDLIVALDYPRPDRAMELVDQLQGLPVVFKVGLELFISGGPEVVRELVHRKCRVFLDLKLHDIPNTVARAAQQAALLKVEMFTLHLSGGSTMVKAAAEVLAEIDLLRPRILGVSVLTSFDDVRWAEITKALTGHAATPDDSVAGLIEHATAWGADGVVCSAVELGMIRKQYPSLFTVVPGIRPAGFSADDQARIMTPGQARVAGADAIVVGRPIIESPRPREVAESILKELSDAAISA